MLVADVIVCATFFYIQFINSHLSFKFALFFYFLYWFASVQKFVQLEPVEIAVYLRRTVNLAKSLLSDLPYMFCSDEIYQQFQRERNLSYNCPACQGESYQVLFAILLVFWKIHLILLICYFVTSVFIQWAGERYG